MRPCCHWRASSGLRRRPNPDGSQPSSLRTSRVISVRLVRPTRPAGERGAEASASQSAGPLLGTTFALCRRRGPRRKLRHPRRGHRVCGKRPAWTRLRLSGPERSRATRRGERCSDRIPARRGSLDGRRNQELAQRPSVKTASRSPASARRAAERLTGHVRAVALPLRAGVRVVGAGRAAGCLDVGGAAGRRSGTTLRDVADPSRGATDHRRRPKHVRGASQRAAVAGFGGVARPRRRAADRSARDGGAGPDPSEQVAEAASSRTDRIATDTIYARQTRCTITVGQARPPLGLFGEAIRAFGMAISSFRSGVRVCC
jgi:hypothetical protein